MGIGFMSPTFARPQSHNQLVEFTILDVELVGPRQGKYALADVQCARSVDFGKTDEMYTCRCHLGNVLKPGDLAMGFDLVHAVFNETDTAEVRADLIPDVVLVRASHRQHNRSSDATHRAGCFGKGRRQGVWEVEQEEAE